MHMRIYDLRTRDLSDMYNTAVYIIMISFGKVRSLQNAF